MKVNMIYSKSLGYPGFCVYNEYEKILDTNNNKIIYTYNCAVMDKDEISAHYGCLKYVGKGYFFFIPFMDFTDKIGLFKMRMNGEKLEPFSEEIISEDISADKEDLFKLFVYNDMPVAKHLLNAVFDVDSRHYMSSCYNEINECSR